LGETLFRETFGSRPEVETMRKAILSLCGFGLWVAVVSPAFVQDSLDLSKVSGTWQYKGDFRYSQQFFKATPEETKIVSSQLGDLAAILSETRVFTPPLGFQPRPLARWSPWECELRHNCMAGPLVSEIDLVFYEMFRDRSGGIGFGGETKSHGYFYINDLPRALPGDCLGAGAPCRTPDRRKMCLEPAETRRVGGYPVSYDHGIETIVLTNGRPAWVPVTAEDYLAALIRSRVADLDESEKKYNQKDPNRPAVEEQLVGPVRRQLAALTPAQRQLQAWVGADPEGGSGLVAPHTAYARPLVTENPEYFDKSRSRTDIQLIVVLLDYYMLNSEPAESEFVPNRRVWQFSNEADWKRIAGLVRQVGQPSMRSIPSLRRSRRRCAGRSDRS
jgi:hypothetical protein